MANGYDDLGSQLQNALVFRKSSFSPDILLHDPITGEEVAASEMFEQQGTRWFIKFDSLPGHLGVKAIGVDIEGLYLETAPVDDKTIVALARDHKIPLIWDAKRSAFLNTASKRMMIKMSRQKINDRDNELEEERELWVMPLPQVSATDLGYAIRLADLVYTADAYEVEEDESFEAPSGPAMAPSMRLGLSFRQSLEITQRPLLSLGTELRPEHRQEQRLEIRQILGLQQQILHMNERQLMDYAMKDLTPEGQKRTLRVLLFVLAGRIKSAKPKMTWKEARKIARTMVVG
jgi:hypothetical protein